MVPSYRSYEEDDILQFENIAENLTSLMRSKEHNRFFTQRTLVTSRRTGLPKVRTVQVWEIEGVAHRDSVTDSRVLEQLRSVLLRNRKIKGKLKNIMSQSRHDLEQRIMDMVSRDLIYDVVLENAAWSHDSTPENDDECFWDYAKVTCAWGRYCEYRYKLGDLHLSQSCRLRDEPLPYDPEIDKKDHFDLNPLKKTTMEVISHRYVYYDDDFEAQFFDMEPWVIVSLGLLGAFLTVFVCSYMIFRIYHVEIVASLKRHSHSLRERVSSFDRGTDVRVDEDGNESDVKVKNHAGVKKEKKNEKKKEDKPKKESAEETKEGKEEAD